MVFSTPSTAMFTMYCSSNIEDRLLYAPRPNTTILKINFFSSSVFFSNFVAILAIHSILGHLKQCHCFLRQCQRLAYIWRKADSRTCAARNRIHTKQSRVVQWFACWTRTKMSVICLISNLKFWLLVKGSFWTPSLGVFYGHSSFLP